MPAKVLAFAGSARRDSFNKKLIRIAAAGATAAGAQVTLIDLADFPMPIYDADLEAASGLPEHAKRFKELMKAHNALLIASPEYNSSISALLKNALDWASRPEPGEKPLVAYAGKVAGLLAASPGATGGMRGLVSLRMMLGNIQVLVTPEQATIPQAGEAFNADGSLKDAKKHEAVQAIGRRVAELAARLNA